MTIEFPERALPPPGTVVRPAVDPVFFLLLRDHPLLSSYGLTIDFAQDLSTRTPPFLRFGVVRYLEPSVPGESTPICSVDVYAADRLAAGDIARALADAWPYLKKLAIPSESAYVSGAWVELDPFLLEEPGQASTAEPLSRYHLEVGLRLHPLPKEAADG